MGLPRHDGEVEGVVVEERRASWAGWDQRAAAMRAREEDKRNQSVVQTLFNEAGNHTIFTPIVMSACGTMGPSMVAYLKEV